MNNKPELGKTNGIFRKMGSSNLSKTFVTAESDPLSALAKTRLTNLNELNDFTRLYSWVMRHQVEQGYNDLVVSLVGRTAIGGYNLALSAMTETGIISPEAMGVPLTKDAMKSLKAEREAKLRQQEMEQGGGRRPDE